MAALLIVALVMGGLAGYSLGTLNPHVTTVTITTTTSATVTTAFSGGLCSTPLVYPNGTGVLVYHVSPGSIGEICVLYEFQSSGNHSFSTVETVNNISVRTYGPLLISENGSIFGACGSTKEPIRSLCAGIDINPSVEVFHHIAGQNITVAYTIQTASNATGAFEFFIEGCLPIILAVGTLPAFAPSPIPDTCPEVPPDMASYVAVTGLSNVSPVLVPEGGGPKL
jgi:hypothetical protein